MGKSLKMNIAFGIGRVTGAGYCAVRQFFQRDSEGQPTQVFGTATDITKHKHAEVALKEINQELSRLASMDGLTKVANRRSFDQYLEKEWENVGSGRSSLSLILCDIDYFKNYNDTYGHQAGDVCLRQVAQAIERAVKRRYSGLGRSLRR